MPDTAHVARIPLADDGARRRTSAPRPVRRGSATAVDSVHLECNRRLDHGGPGHRRILLGNASTRNRPFRRWIVGPARGSPVCPAGDRSRQDTAGIRAWQSDSPSDAVKLHLHAPPHSRRATLGRRDPAGHLGRPMARGRSGRLEWLLQPRTPTPNPLAHLSFPERQILDRSTCPYRNEPPHRAIAAGTMVLVAHMETASPRRRGSRSDTDALASVPGRWRSGRDPGGQTAIGGSSRRHRLGRQSLRAARPDAVRCRAGRVSSLPRPAEGPSSDGLFPFGYPSPVAVVLCRLPNLHRCGSWPESELLQPRRIGPSPGSRNRAGSTPDPQRDVESLQRFGRAPQLTPGCHRPRTGGGHPQGV